jgi:hypothetical protein
LFLILITSKPLPYMMILYHCALNWENMNNGSYNMEYKVSGQINTVYINPQEGSGFRI